MSEGQVIDISKRLEARMEADCAAKIGEFIKNHNSTPVELDSVIRAWSDDKFKQAYIRENGTGSGALARNRTSGTSVSTVGRNAS